jgi:Arc/MetJ-type ribon-helix-helix transcriptional regulator
MTIHVSKDVESSIEAAVRNGRFPSVEDAITAAWTAFDAPTQAPETAPPDPLSILEMVDELRKRVPPEEFAKLPTDGAKQLDHYLYGTPKRTDA